MTAHVGEGAIIYPLAKIVRGEQLRLGDHSTVDDFVYLDAGIHTVIGRYVHIGNHASVIGGGELEVGDYAVIATGARILTATDTFHGGARMSTHLPEEFRHVVRGKVAIADERVRRCECGRPSWSDHSAGLRRRCRFGRHSRSRTLDGLRRLSRSPDW